MLLRKPLSLWICVSVFVVSATLIPLVNRLRCRPTDPPRTLAELKVRLSQCTPPLSTVWYFENDPENGMWVCARPRSRAELPTLLRLPETIRKPQRANHWKGLVFCDRVGAAASIPEEFIREY